jgi:hypothetical protein
MNKDALLDRIEELISGLDGNDAAQAYYLKVKDRLLSITNDDELKKFLNAICGSAKIKDAHGFNRVQSGIWNNMWKEADKMLSKMNME